MFPLFNFTRAVLRRVGSELDMAERKSVALHVRELVAPTADELGLKLWAVEYVKEGADDVLRITIDSDEGITIDDCERFHRAIDPVIDEDDPIENSYKLEVSSPGVERVLTRPEHFEAMKGAEVEIRLFSAVNGSKIHRGILKGYSDGDVIAEENGEDTVFPKAAVSQVQTVFEWSAPHKRKTENHDENYERKDLYPL